MSEFAAHLHEVFAELGPIAVRRMFGGHGVYHQGLMFALVADESLYLKADAEIISLFTARDLPPFRYRKQGKEFSIAYHLAPDEVLEDPSAAAEWGRRSYGAALRASKGKVKVKSKASAKTSAKP